LGHNVEEWIKYLAKVDKMTVRFVNAFLSLLHVDTVKMWVAFRPSCSYQQISLFYLFYTQNGWREWLSGKAVDLRSFRLWVRVSLWPSA